jgi:predicted phosphodiesterase
MDDYTQLIIPCFPKLSISKSGKLTESFWLESLKLTPQKIFKSKNLLSSASTEVRVCMDNKNLYIGFTCNEELSINEGNKENTTPHESDNVEFCIGNINYPLWYSLFIIGVNNIKLSRMIDNKDWNVFLSIEKNVWFAKIIVPLKKLGSFDKGVVINVLRERKEAKEIITLQELKERALEIENFAKIETYSSLVNTPWTFRVKTESFGIAWATKTKSPAKVFYRKKGSKSWNICTNITTKDNNIYSCEIKNLEENTIYEYFICGMNKIKSISTLSAENKDFSFALTSDIHTSSSKLRQLLQNKDVKKSDLFFMLGDQLDASLAAELHFSAYLDAIVKKWKKPFYCLYGNHEGRGIANNSFYDLYSNGKVIGFDRFIHKGIYFVILDTDHDNGIDENYRTEQTKFLKETVNLEEYKNAQFRVLLSHIPITYKCKRWGNDQIAMLNQLSYEEYNSFDVAFSGHTHTYCCSVPDKDNIFSKNLQYNNIPKLRSSNFPEFTQQDSGLVLVNKISKFLEIEIFNDKGEIIDKYKIKAKNL